MFCYVLETYNLVTYISSRIIGTEIYQAVHKANIYICDPLRENRPLLIFYQNTVEAYKVS